MTTNTNSLAYPTEPKALSDFWREHVTQLQSSGMTKRAYATTMKLDYHRFLYWCRKFTKDTGTPEDFTTGFTQLQLTSAATEPNILASISLPTGQRINIHEVTALTFLLKNISEH